MAYSRDTFNLILSGGGVKGIAYVGMFEAAEQKEFKWGNIAGVSAGALAGSFAAAGYTAAELKSIMEEFDFGSIKLDDISKRLSELYRFPQLCNDPRTYRGISAKDFLNRLNHGKTGFEYRSNKERVSEYRSNGEFSPFRGGVIESIINVSKESYILDGDALEEWVRDVLSERGISTFGDLRGGTSDKVNPRGYKIRVTTVDANRGKVIVLPDDMVYYGINPDQFEVARAVRMSASVPFAFKPVELHFKKDGTVRTHNFIDGGVFDNFPFWLIDNSKEIRKVGFRLDGGPKKSIISLNTPIAILKSLIGAVYDIGIPKNTYNIGYVGSIDTSKVSFLDFKLSSEDKQYLIESGKRSGSFLFSKIKYMDSYNMRRRFGFFRM